MKTKKEVSVEKISDSLTRILFDTKKYYVPAEISSEPTCDRFIPDHSANVNFDLSWAGIIDISTNTLMMDKESIDILVEKVIEVLN